MLVYKIINNSYSSVYFICIVYENIKYLCVLVLSPVFYVHKKRHEMKLTRTFNITSQEFYDYLKKLLLADIQKVINRNVKTKDLVKRCRYEKR